VIFPIDDQDPGVVYAGSWAQSTGSTDTFAGTTTASSTWQDSATFSFTGGSQACLIGIATPDTRADADVRIDGVAVASSVTEFQYTQPLTRLNCWDLDGDVSHTLTVSVSLFSGLFVLDGLEVDP
jgi:hypothetical protein